MKCTRVLGLVLVAAAAGCGDSDPIRPAPDVASVVIANLAFGSADVVVEATGVANPLAVDLDFAEYTASCVSVPAGQPVALTFRSGEQEIASRVMTLTVGERYTVLLTDDAAGVDVILLGDDFTPPDLDQRAARVVNAGDDPVDVYLFPDGGDMGAPFASGLAYVGDLGDPPSYATRAADETMVRFFPAGMSSGTPLAEEMLPTRDQAPLITIVLSETATGPEIFGLGPCQ